MLREGKNADKDCRPDGRYGPRKRAGFDANGGVVCKGCFALRNENSTLKAEVQKLKQRLHYREVKSKVTSPGEILPRGAHTPSSRIDCKENAAEENRLKRGGAQVGHKGHGRESCSGSAAAEVIEVAHPVECRECACTLNMKDVRERTVIEAVPVIARKVVYRCRRGVCPKCFKVYPGQPPALAKNLYGNSLIAQAAVMHFYHGIPIGKILAIFGEEVGLGGLIECFHRVGRLAGAVKKDFIEQYRKSAVKHADETGWRNDGRSGYAWLFATASVSIFEFKGTRSAEVPREIFGAQPLPGVLVVDRYGAYNKMPVQIQYCYAHLLRDVSKLEEEFCDSADVASFCSRLGSLLTQAMKLRSFPISDEQYRKQAQSLQARIESMMKEAPRHIGIQSMQELFTTKRERLYHWASSREVPADNNRAERELRPLVVARKVSFGSQSDAGANTRAVMMTLLHTANKRLKGKSLEAWLKNSLDQIARDPATSFSSLMPTAPPSTPSN